MAGGLEPDDLSGPFPPKPFYDSMILKSVRENRMISRPRLIISAKCGVIHLYRVINTSI